MFSQHQKKGQVTLFVIISVILVVILISFVVLKPYILGGSSPVSNPEAYLQKCATDSVKKTEDILIKNNLNLNQNFTNFYLYRSEKVPFLCTNYEFYFACVPQEPSLFLKIQKIIENRAMVDVQNCFNQLKKEFNSQGYTVQDGALSLNVSLNEKAAIISVFKQFIAKKDESSISLSNLEFNQPTSLYKLIKTAQTIVNYESTVCEFNEVNWMMAMHDILISKFVGSDSTKVYTLKDRYSNEEIKFAIKSCVLPAGL
ncbi:Uncharacterised protein [uncultured archaeon]|nr:Uncharacterised protein [uncultured archaeon]